MKISKRKNIFLELLIGSLFTYLFITNRIVLKTTAIDIFTLVALGTTLPSRFYFSIAAISKNSNNT